MDELKNRLDKLNIIEKNKLITKYFTKERVVDDKDLDLLFELDDYWYIEYNKYRNKSFTIARIKATEHLLNLVYNVNNS